ncbi:MAG: NADH-quinone oxidoreductase subunit K [Deinococcota bacterium]
MELLLPLLASLLFATGIYLLLARDILRVIIGLNMISYGVNLSILLVGGSNPIGAPPILQAAFQRYVDPLPQALILTAIVIGFGTTALILVLGVQAYQATGSDQLQDILQAPDPVDSHAATADPERPSISPEMTTERPSGSRH